MDKGKEYILAIDPDVDKSGYCVMVYGKILQLYNIPLWDVFDHLLMSYVGFSDDFINDNVNKENFVVLVEKSQGKNTSWVGGGKGSARDVGRNQEIANQIIKFCKEKDFHIGQ